MTSTSADHEQTLPPDVEMAFAPLHKRAFGMAVGVAAALACFLVTAVYLVRDPQPGFDLGLLDHFFYGYTVSWRGAVIAAVWGGFAGFVAGWFVAFARNLILGILVFVTRTRNELDATRDFLDHI